MSDATPTPIEPVAEATPEAAPQTTFTQDDVNRINAADRRRDREELAALKAQLESLSPKAEEFDRIKAEQMTALEKAESEKAELAAKLTDYEARVAAQEREKKANEVALKVAAELGIDPAAALDFADTITGDDDAAMEESAKKRFAHLRPAPAANPTAIHDVLAPDPDKTDPFLIGLSGGRP